MKTVTLQDFSNQIIESMNSLIQKTITESEILIGIDRVKVDSITFKTKKHLDICNIVLDAWLVLFPGERTLEVFKKEVLPLTQINAKNIDIELRKRWAAANKITGVKGFKLEKLLMALDLTNDQEQAIDQITSIFSSFAATIFPEYIEEDIWSEGQFKLTQKRSSEIEKLCEVKANAKDINLILALTLVEGGLGIMGKLIDTRDIPLSYDPREPSVESNSRWKDLIQALKYKLKPSDSNPKEITINWAAALKDRFDLVYQNLKVDHIRFGSPAPVLQSLEEAEV